MTEGYWESWRKVRSVPDILTKKKNQAFLQRLEKEMNRRESLTISQIADHLDKVQWVSKTSFKACCPCHSDRTPSLKVSEGNRPQDTVDILVICYAGCDQATVFNEILERCGNGKT